MKAKCQSRPRMSPDLIILFDGGCDKLKSRDRLNKGVQVPGNAKDSDTIELFKEAMPAATRTIRTPPYLGRTREPGICGSGFAGNQRLATAKRNKVQRSLNKNPKDSNTLGSMAFLSYNEATNPRMRLGSRN